ncbi:unnamed protein product [Caenorhabditis brenneri]
MHACITWMTNGHEEKIQSQHYRSPELRLQRNLKTTNRRLGAHDFRMELLYSSVESSFQTKPPKCKDKIRSTARTMEESWSNCLKMNTTVNKNNSCAKTDHRIAFSSHVQRPYINLNVQPKSEEKAPVANGYSGHEGRIIFDNQTSNGNKSKTLLTAFN